MNEVLRQHCGPDIKADKTILYLGGYISDTPDSSVKIARQTPRAWACCRECRCHFYGQPGVDLKRKVRIMKAEVIEALQYGSMLWTSLNTHHKKLSQTHHALLHHWIGWRKQNRADHAMSFRETLVRKGCGSIDTAVRKRQTLSAGLEAAWRRDDCRSTQQCLER